MLRSEYPAVRFRHFRHLFVKYSAYLRRRELRRCNIESLELASCPEHSGYDNILKWHTNRLTRAWIIFSPRISPTNCSACVPAYNVIIEHVQYSWLVLDDWSTARPRLTLLLFAQAGCDYGSRALRELSSFAVPCRAHVVSYIIFYFNEACTAVDYVVGSSPLTGVNNYIIIGY